MKVFVSGGAGFIGSHLVTRLLTEQSNERVVIFDNFSSGKPSHLSGLVRDRRLEIVKADLKDIDAIKKGMAGCETVFHLAANPDISKAITQPEIDFWEGTYLTHNVLEAMRTTGARQIFFASGSGVYGENPAVTFREDYGPCVPISTYGASKLACEGLIAAYCHLFGLCGHAFRFANVVGSRQTHGVGYDFLRRLNIDPHKLRILGDGTQSKSYIHVDDVVAAMLLVGEKCTVGFDVFNVATDDYLTVREIADIAVSELGHDPSAVRYEYTGSNRGWKGDVPQVRLDVTKIKSLGWHCQRRSEEAIRDALRAMRQEITSAVASDHRGQAEPHG